MCAQTADMPESVTFWDRTKQYSSTAYEKALKPGWNKAYGVVNKLESPVNRISNRVGSESFWPGSLDKESDKAARILRSFCKDGFYEDIDTDIAARAEADRRDPTVNVPQGKQRVMVKIPAKVIQEAKGLAIFTCMRTGWVVGGSGGAGVLVGRHPETGEWSPPSGIHMQNLSFGFLAGVDILDTVLVINTYEALSAFTRFRCTLGTEVGLAAGPVGIGGLLETSVHKKPAPVWSYVKSRGLYGGIGVDGNVVIERTDENERFYGERVGVSKILLGEVRYPPRDKYKVLTDTIRAAQGENVDNELLPDGVAPSDMELEPPGPIFGVPSEDDPDPYGFRALEAEGLVIREAGTHRKATPDSFEFRPSPTSPVYSTFRQSIDHTVKRKEWRGSIASIASMDRGTQTDGEDSRSPRFDRSPARSSIHVSSPRIMVNEILESPEEEKSEPIAPISNGAVHAHDEPNEEDIKTALPIENGASPLPDEVGEEVVRGDEEREKTVKNDDEKKEEHDDDYSDLDSDVEIITAVPVSARPRAGVVNVPKRIPPALPPRNPDRLSTRSPISEEPTTNGFEPVPLMDDSTNDTTGDKYFSNAKMNGEDVFHSIPPTPIEEKKHIDEFSESFR